jgi:aryl-alcohol dehydrogenase-like predicted oxidoreductase
MEMATLGRTGLKVSRLGVGLVEIGFQLSEGEVDLAGRLLNIALEGGINFFDTAECYGISEDLIGATISHRRDDFILATKAGHPSFGTDGPRFTGDTVRKSIERSLKRLKTDHVDLLQVHAYDIFGQPPDDIIEAVLDAKKEGKTRFVGYSQENEEAMWAIQSGLFDTIQTAFSILDQRARHGIFEAAKAANIGIIAKRPIGNGMWGRTFRSEDHYEDTVARRLGQRSQKMQAAGPIDGETDNRIETALGFVLAHPEVDTAIVGTRNPDHMQSNIDIVDQRLPIDEGVVTELHRRYDDVGADWRSID